MTALTAAQLTTPLPSGVVPGVTPLNVAANTWLANLLANAGTLPVASWQTGGVAWTEMLDFATQLAISDASISIVAQGTLLDFASTGTVTYVNANGNTVTVPVTPDPSIPAQNPTGAPGWLDALASSGFATTRIPATYASGTLYLANITGASFGTYLPGTFHAANTFTGAGFSNSASFTFGPSTTVGAGIASVTFQAGGDLITTNAGHGLANGQVVYISGCPGLTFGVVASAAGSTFVLVNSFGSFAPGAQVWTTATAAFVADLIGPGSNAGANQVIVTTTSVPGGAVANITSWSGSAYESNIALATRCRAHNQSLSVNGPKGAYYYYALVASVILAAQTPPSSLTSPVTRATVAIALGTGAVTTTIASASGAVPGVSNVVVTAATNASPIVLTLTSTAGITTGMICRVQGVNGNVAANGIWTVTVVGATLSLAGSTGSGAYSSGGIVEAGDLGLVDSVIQAYAVPNAVTAITQSASPIAVAVSTIVYVPLSFVSDYGTNPATNKGATAVSGYLSNLTIGGILGVDNSVPGVVPISKIYQILFDAGQSAGRVYTVSVGPITLNANTGVDVVLGATQVVTVGTLNIQVIGV